MTGPLTLKRRFVEENFGSANFSFQKLQLLDNISNFANFNRLLPFVNKLPPQETKLSPLMVSGETPSTKKIATVRVDTLKTKRA